MKILRIITIGMGILFLISTIEIIVTCMKIDKVKIPIDKNINAKYHIVKIDTTGTIKTVWYMKGK